MPITVEDRGGILCPAVVCDWCQERVASMTEWSGVVLWSFIK